MDKIYKIMGNNPKEMTIKILEYLNPIISLPKDKIIGIKPNLVCSTPASYGATTHPEIVEGIIEYLKKNGYYNIKVLESAWVGDDTKTAYKVCGYEDISKKHDIPLIDLKADKYITKNYKGVDINICKSVFEIDYLINVPLIKGHCQTKITCALKNMKGLIPDFEKRRFHTLGLHTPIACLNKFIKQDLIIADGICPDPYFEEGGRPKKLNTIAVGFDPVLMDSYVAGVLGYEPHEIKYITLAQKEGIGKIINTSTQIIDITDKQHSTCFNDIKIEKMDKKYLNIIDEQDACSACYSNLVSALTKLYEEGLTEKFAENICIGQAYKGYKGCLGVGDCTSCFKKSLPGCPPSVDEIVEFLRG